MALTGVALASGGDSSAGRGVEGKGENAWQRVCAARHKRGKRQNKTDKDDHQHVEPVLKRPKAVRFSAMAEVCDIAGGVDEDGFDEYTLGNLDEKGRPFVDMSGRPGALPKLVSNEAIAKMRVKFRKDELMAHHLAVDWITGRKRELPPARRVIFC